MSAARLDGAPALSRDGSHAAHRRSRESGSSIRGQSAQYRLPMSSTRSRARTASRRGSISRSSRRRSAKASSTAPDGATVKTMLAKPQTYMNEVRPLGRRHHAQALPRAQPTSSSSTTRSTWRSAASAWRPAARRRGPQRHPLDLRAGEHRMSAAARMGVGHPGDKERGEGRRAVRLPRPTRTPGCQRAAQGLRRRPALARRGQ